MRRLALVLVMAATGCAAPAVEPPSLAPRAAEAIDPRVPVPEPAVTGVADPQLVARLDALVAQALAGDEAFRAVIDEARARAAAAGPPESESWVVAQQALSAAVAARGPVTRAIGEIDALGAQRVMSLGGIEPANLRAIEAAAARVAEIDERQARIISELQARLRG